MGWRVTARAGKFGGGPVGLAFGGAPVGLAFGGALVGLAACVLAAGASAAGTLPRSPTYLGVSPGSSALQVRPQVISYTGDGTGYLGGAHGTGKNARIHWTQWTTKTAHGTGYNRLNNCVPYCATGTYTGYRIKIELWRPRTVHGVLVFTRLTIFYVRHRPKGEPRHYTFTDLYTGNGFGWGPPGARVYCVHTSGQPPAAGCRNIHSLP